MIYSGKNLVVKILFENTSKKSIAGLFRPSAYVLRAGNYFTVCKIDFLKKEIEPGGQAVLTAVLEAPVGFGDYLKEGAVLSLRNGLDEQGRALVLEIKGYME